MMVASFRYNDTGLALTKGVNGETVNCFLYEMRQPFLKVFVDLSIFFFDSKL